MAEAYRRKGGKALGMGGIGSGRKKVIGRPTKLTPQLQDELVRLVEVGNYIDTAANACGLKRETVRDWMKRGARGEVRYKAFSSALKKAEAKACASGLVRIRQAGRQQWQAEAWFLERRFPNQFARRSRDDDPNAGVVPQVKVYMPDNGRLPEGTRKAVRKKAKPADE